MNRAHRPIRSLACIAAVSAAVLASGCTALDGSSCVDHQTSFQQQVASEGQLDNVQLEAAAADPANTAYPMAVVLSQGAINKLFAAVAGTDLPSIPLVGDVAGFEVGVTVHPQLPLIQIGGATNTCVECLLTQVGMGLTFNILGQEFGGSGLGTYQFPLLMTPNGIESTSVHARFDEVEVLDLQIDLDLGAFPDEAILGYFKPLIEQEVQTLIRSQIGSTNLVDLQSWDIGDGDVKLVGHGPHIDSASETIVIGMHSNLLAATSSVDWQPALPEGADIGLQFSPDIVGAMISRLMNEGHIDRSYDASGDASPSGDHQVTFQSMGATQSGLLDTNFTLWRTGGGFCGFANMQAGLGLSISDQRLKLDIDNVQVTDSAGAGQLLQFAGDWAGSDFLSNVANFSELTLNYGEFALPNNMQADMSAESFNLSLDGRGLSLFLNIEQIIGIEEQ